LLAAFGAVLITGCQSHREEQAQGASRSFVNQFRDAVNRQDWEKAWGFSEQVLLLHGNDLDTLRTVARVAYLNKKPVAAAGLLVDAAKLDQFNDPALVQQATVALISVGRLFEALELLDRAVESQPAHHELRRLLFDFLVGVEDHEAAQIHGRELVLRRHPTYDPAMLLLGRSLVRSGDIDQLSNQFESLPKPSIGGLASQRQMAESPLQGGPPSVRPTLINEAEQRGLQFFGYGREDLDSPGILFDATLGCGGGAIDFDLDGWTDLYLMSGGGTVGKNDSKPNSLQRNLQGQFLEVSGRSGADDRGFGVGVATGDLNSDGFTNMLLLNYGPNRLLINNGDGTFRDVSGDNPALQELRWSSSGAIADLDRDGLADILIVNDMSNNHFWSQNSQHPFGMSESAVVCGLATDDFAQPQGSMGIASGDLDRDGDLDLFVTNFESEYNTFYQYENSGVWRDATRSQGLASEALPMVGFGTEAVDFDLDGNMELAVANGHIDVYEDEQGKSKYYQPFQLFKREASGRFELVRDFPSNSYLGTRHVGRAVWTLDADRDGRLDLAVTHQTEPVALLMNRTKTSNHWLSIRVKGSRTSRDAIGTSITVSQGSDEWTGFLTSGDGYLCSNERVLHFGLGASDDEVAVTVKWPDGTIEQPDPLAVDQRWLIVQGQAPFSLSE